MYGDVKTRSEPFISEYHIGADVNFIKYKCKPVPCYIKRTMLATELEKVCNMGVVLLQGPVHKSVEFSIRMPLKHFKRFKRSYVTGHPIKFKVERPNGWALEFDKVTCCDITDVRTGTDDPLGVSFRACFIHE